MEPDDPPCSHQRSLHERAVQLSFPGPKAPQVGPDPGHLLQGQDPPGLALQSEPGPGPEDAEALHVPEDPHGTPGEQQGPQLAAQPALLHPHPAGPEKHQSAAEPLQDVGGGPAQGQACEHCSLALQGPSPGQAPPQPLPASLGPLQGHKGLVQGHEGHVQQTGPGREKPLKRQQAFLAACYQHIVVGYGGGVRGRQQGSVGPEGDGIVRPQQPPQQALPAGLLGPADQAGSGAGRGQQGQAAAQQCGPARIGHASPQCSQRRSQTTTMHTI
mmetsp:Transcript_5891/g.8776  ORF Transcript_5891/g.8776 Transcript_5891/m.8776 type:complete len:272 (+) Transcript_5891:1842-2657(+)